MAQQNTCVYTTATSIPVLTLAITFSIQTGSFVSGLLHTLASWQPARVVASCVEPRRAERVDSQSEGYGLPNDRLWASSRFQRFP